MMNVRIWLVAAYIPCAVWTYGAMTAEVDHHSRHEIREYGVSISCGVTPDSDEVYKAFRVGTAVLPIAGWGSALLITGFYEHGWKARVTACADAGYKETVDD